MYTVGWGLEERREFFQEKKSSALSPSLSLRIRSERTASHHQTKVCVYLEHSEARLGERVEMAPRVNGVGEFAAEDLHPQKGENENEQEQNHQQRVDRGNRVHQRFHKVAHRGPVSEKRFGQCQTTTWFFENGEHVVEKSQIFFEVLKICRIDVGKPFLKNFLGGNFSSRLKRGIIYPAPFLISVGGERREV